MYYENRARRCITTILLNACHSSMGDCLGAGTVLDGIERQLTQAAEMQLTGALSDELYVSVVRGALRLVPMLERPQHIVVLKALKVWKENELLPEQAYGTCNGIFLYVCQAFAIFLNS